MKNSAATDVTMPPSTPQPPADGDRLNPPQRQAVEHVDGPLLVLAGAGTGKTRVLTTRMAYILRQGKASPGEVMAVTFTNKAAREMAQRVEMLLGRPTAGMWLGTFHSLCARLLRTHPERVGLSPNFTIIDTDDQQRLCKQVLAEHNVDDKTHPPRQLGWLISRWKDNAWTPDDVPHQEAEAIGGLGVILYRAYQARLEANNAVDFGDLLLKAYRLLKDNTDLLTHYQKQFKYVLVDEYQDTNAVQYLWVRLLVMVHKNICVVGDDDQSIYAWRGAQVGNILRFEQDFPGARVIKLEQNYRSTSNILKAAAGLIAHNSDRHDKTLWTEGADGHPVEVHPVADGKDEARMVADRIESEIRAGKSYEDMAVLVRTAAQTRSFEEQFIKNGQPYVIVGGLRFYERKEIRDAIAYLRLVLADADSLAFERIVNIPKRGVGETAMLQLADIARNRGLPMLAAARVAVNEGLVSTRVLRPLGEFVRLIDDLRTRISEKTPDRLMELILEDAGYLEMLRQDKNEDAKTRQENLRELVRAMQEYASVEAFTEHVSLVMDGDTDGEAAIRVTTVHAAKGLEFDTVFLPGFEEGLVPHQRALNEEGTKGLEEERRLAYVAMTRAKRLLVISYAAARFMYGGFNPCVASRFLDEMPQDCLNILPSTTQTHWRPAAGSRYDSGRRKSPMFPANFREADEVSGVNTLTDYPIGTRVFHHKFGYGRVKRQEGTGANQQLTITFDKAGDKKLVASLARLELA